MTLDISGFLLARISEDEDEAKGLQQETDFGLEACGDYMLDECAVKRAIIQSYESCVKAQNTEELGMKLVSTGMATGLEIALKCFAEVHKGHPDYRPEWAL